MTAIELLRRTDFLPPQRMQPGFVPAAAAQDGMRLTAAQCHELLARNSLLTSVNRLDDGIARFSIERYRFTGTALYLAPAKRLSWYASADSRGYIEGDVSEVEGLRSWSYVTLRGVAELLQPTGAEGERREWNDGLEALRSVLPGLPETRQLLFSNFPVLRVARFELTGWTVRLEDEQPARGALLE